MTLQRRGNHWYGTEQADLRRELSRYSKANGYTAHHFQDAACVCGGRIFRLKLDDDEGVAIRICPSCATEHPMGDSSDFLEDASPEECACPCGNEQFEITVGVSLHADTEDVRWLYIGCRCAACGLTAVFGDWKNEGSGYRGLLASV
jgi:hypothetical protein